MLAYFWFPLTCAWFLYCWSPTFNFYSILVIFLRWFICESIQVRCLKLHEISFKIMGGYSGKKCVILQARWKRMARLLGLLRTERALYGQWTAIVHSSSCQFTLGLDFREQPKCEKFHIQLLVFKLNRVFPLKKWRFFLNKKNVVSLITYMQNFTRWESSQRAVFCTLSSSLLSFGRKCSSSPGWDVCMYEWFCYGAGRKTYDFHSYFLVPECFVFSYRTEEVPTVEEA